jgi:hypothetical protein
MTRITTPAERIITKCGRGNFSNGLKVISGLTGKDITSIRRWTYEKAEGGTGGLVPAPDQQVILASEPHEGFGIVPDDFFWGPAELSRLALAGTQ